MQEIISNKRELINLVNSIQIKDNTLYNFSFEEVKQSKTLKQLGFIFGGLIKALSFYFYETDGVHYEPETIKEMLYDCVGLDEILYLPTGKKIVVKKSLSKMTKQEASEFINQSINWIDENTDCVLPIGLRYLWTRDLTDEYITSVMSEPAQERNDFYLQQIRKMNCIYCGKPNAEAHHIRKGFNGKSLKPPDYMAIPLCHECHIGIAHGKGEETLLKGMKNVLNGLDIKVFCRLLYERTLTHR